MIIEATLFVPPKGGQRAVYREAPDEYAPKYRAILDAGCRITLEPLRLTGEVSVCIEHPAIGDFDTEILSPERDDSDKILEMIQRFDRKKFDEWKEQME